MPHTPHELGAEFPDDHAVMHALKVSSPHFAHLADTYHDVNRHIHRIESLIEPASDETLTELKRQRLALKDEIAALIAADKRAVA
ncbi:YdcH family protein [Mongoliimonas terrestris]|uniref:YdcH family protein n=1 Tax=Mongoliimonas terrestris TaxID=1709001 RepID=UPI00094982FE|nr:YdcH family protein [Mongoliimonas terrestris]